MNQENSAMVEKIYEVTMGVRQKTTLPRPLPWQPEKFRVFGRLSDEAITYAVLKAVEAFPITAWEYDQENAKVEEVSREQIDKELEDHRERIALEGQARIEKALDDLAKTGVNLRRPKQGQ